MKIAICIKKDLSGCLSLNRLLEGLEAQHEVHVVLSDFVLAAERDNEYSACMVRHERDFMLEHVFTYVDTHFPELTNARCLTYEGLQKRYDVPIELWGNIAGEEAVAAMQVLAPDLILSCRYDYIFRESVLSIPPLGIYGLHPGALPELRGLCSPFRAMEKGHTHSGCSLFEVDKGLDTGSVVDIGWAEIDYSRCVLWNFVHTYFAGIDVLLQYLPQLEAECPLPSVPQDTAKQAYYTYPTSEEFKRFVDKGGTLVTEADYVELLSWFLPEQGREEHLRALMSLLYSLEC